MGYHAANRKPKCQICGRRFQGPASADRDARHPNCHTGKCVRTLLAGYQRAARERRRGRELDAESEGNPRQANPNVAALVTAEIGEFCRLVVMDRHTIKL